VEGVGRLRSTPPEQRDHHDDGLRDGYQTIETDAAIPRPARVRLAIDEIGGLMREGLLAWPCRVVSA